ncbi:hypothetical protein [Yoonia sp.]|uniref:hypothetical protein n=1 Tax=Yoonia sp. TaxID=2212373 RepID=UPI002DFC0D28|nr:hypothetical protein [Yoonia sp.]
MTCVPTFFELCAEALGLLVRPRTFYRTWREFSAFDQGDKLVVSPDFVSVIGALLPIALWGLTRCSLNAKPSDFRGHLQGS